MATEYPTLATLTKIGTTVGNRDISSIVITSQKLPLLQKPAVKLVGGVHGNEVCESFDLLVGGVGEGVSLRCSRLLFWA